MPLDSTHRLGTSLAGAALESLRSLFGEIGHDPSEAQWDAIIDLMTHLELAANGELEPSTTYLSAIPAGTGKTTSVQAFAMALAADPKHATTGMLVAVNRKQEADDMALALESVRDRLCVICGKDEARDRGDHRTADRAQIVVTTQAVLKEVLRHSPNFAGAAQYHFGSRKRAVVVWDESIAFRRPVVLDSNDVLGLAGLVAQQSQEARNALLGWCLDVPNHAGSVCDVPTSRPLGWT